MKDLNDAIENVIKNYLKKNMSIQVSALEDYDKAFQVAIFLDDEEIDSDEIFL